MPSEPIPGRALVTRRAIRDVVRSATLRVYGVSGFARDWPLAGLLGWLRIREPGIRLRLAGAFDVDVHVTVAAGLPVAEVARQVDASIRYALGHAIGRQPDRLTIHVDGLRYEPGSPPADPPPHPAVGPSELADSGTDVA